MEDLVVLAQELKDHLLATPPQPQPAQPTKAQRKGKRKKNPEPAADLSDEVGFRLHPHLQR